MFPSDTELDAKFTFETATSSLAGEDTPFNILLMGDWSGSGGQTSSGGSSAVRPVEIDRDNFDDVMKRFRVGLNLSFEGGISNALALEFAELDDFHPDKIFERVPLFSNLRDIRRKLSNSSTYNEAAREVRSWLVNNDSGDGESGNRKTTVVDDHPTPNDLLDQILGQTSEEGSAPVSPTAASSELSAFVGKLVKPHLIQTDAVEQSNLLLVVDEITSDLMRKILHHPQFQALESAWRGAYLLVRKIDTNNQLKIFLLDIDKSKLSDDLKGSSDLNNTQTHLLLNDADKSWAMVGGNYTFGLNIDDVALLIRLAKIGNSVNVPFVSHIQPELFGLKSFSEFSAGDKLIALNDSNEAKLWDALRSLPEASHLGLALPRFLSRIPYGEKTEPTENFYFEEFTDNTSHDQFLWTNPAFVCALLLAQSFSASGWNFSNSIIQDITDLPLYLYKEDGETKTKSCAEIVMMQTNAEILISQGLMPLISFRDTDRLRVGRFQSVTHSESMLSGKWK